MRSTMEQKRYWMWRRKLGERALSSQIPLISVGSSYSKSWEEQAFAEDSAGHLGGCIWPPRSYTCSFCRREFRSAQALGGHMNVHRRDRARLKQSSSPSGEPPENSQHHHHLSPCTPPVGTQYPPQTGSLVYNSNPKPNPNFGIIESSLSPKVSAASTEENLSERTSISPSFSACVARDNLKESLSPTTGPPKNSLTVGLCTITELKLGRESLRLAELGCRARRDPDDEDEAISIKKRRSYPTSPSFVKPSSSGDPQQVQSEELKFSPRPVEELDLELRLGDPPAAK